MNLEVVVRPIVLPDIRPPAPRRIAPPDDPTKGLATLGGGGSGTFIGTSASQSVNMTKQKPHKETRRQVDVERVYQTDDAGNVNRNTFIDVERMKKVRAEAKDGGNYQTLRTIFTEAKQRDNVQVIESNKTILPSDE